METEKVVVGCQLLMFTPVTGEMNSHVSDGRPKASWLHRHVPLPSVWRVPGSDVGMSGSAGLKKQDRTIAPHRPAPLAESST